MKNLLFIVGISIALTSCHDIVDGSSGAMTSQYRQEPLFRAIQMDGNIDVFVTQDTSFTIKVEAGENLINYIETSVVGDMLVIYEAPNNIVNTKPIKVYLTMDSLYDVSMEGSGNLDVNNMLCDHLNFESIGSGDANLEITGQSVNLEMRGSGDAYLIGTANSFNAYIQGSGDLNARFLQANDVNIEIEGSGDAIVYAANSLIATITGSGDIIYYGSPNTVTTSVSGSGNIYAH